MTLPEKLAQLVGIWGCSSFPAHVGGQHPDVPLGIALPTPSRPSPMRSPSPPSSRSRAPASTTSAPPASWTRSARRRRRTSRSGLFGRGTSGEGCDVETLALPGAQQPLLEAVLDSGTPTVVVLLTGRPYALGTAPVRAAAIVQAFFPGGEGSAAIAGC